MLDTFSPAEKITRADFMVLLVRTLDRVKKLGPLETGTVPDRFTDKEDIRGYAVESVAMLIYQGLIEGSGDKINPWGNTTRAEAAVFLYRIYNKQ